MLWCLLCLPLLSCICYRLTHLSILKIEYNNDPMTSEHDFKFCPNCGGKFAKKGSNLLVCPKCDLHYYINPRPANGVIIENEKGELLFIKRAWPPKKGLLDVVGGFVDVGETFEESMRREAREEIGIELKDFKYVGSYTDRYEYKGLNYHTVALVYSTHLPSNTDFKIGEEGELVWVDKDKIEYDKIAFDGLKKALHDYHKK